MTTPARQPHPQRCETCTNQEWTGRDLSIPDCMKCDHTPTSGERRFVEQMGCATHTSTPPPAPECPDILSENPCDVKACDKCPYYPAPAPEPIDYLECARMDIRGNSYISGDSMVVDMEEVDAVINKLKDERIRSRPHTPAPASTVINDSR